MTARVTSTRAEATVPDWFTRAVSIEPERGELRAAGARIAYRAWGGPARDGQTDLLLVHGGAANARWWDHIAPWLSANRRVVAVDLSGHGHSDFRPRYTRELWAREVLAVAATLSPRPIIIGHSLGGFVTLEAAGRQHDELGGIVVVDSPVQTPSAEGNARKHRRSLSRPRIYPTMREITARFRPFPDDGAQLVDYVCAHVAEHSVRARPDGYSWQFDPAIFAGGGMSPDEVVAPDCPVAVIRGEHGSLNQEHGDELAVRTGPGTVRTTIPGAGHHIMLDQPIALTATLDTLVGVWSTGTVRKPSRVEQDRKQ